MSRPRDLTTPIERAERYLRALIARMEPGDQVPPVAQLENLKLGGPISRETWRRSLKRLEAEGLVVTRSRWATVVAPRPDDDDGDDGEETA